MSSDTRRKILSILAKKEIHISGLAKELGISVPITAKHIEILENAGLVERKKFGRTHVLKANLEKQYQVLDELADSVNVEIPKGASVLDALREVSGVTVQKVEDREYVTSIEGEEGYYIYEVNGNLPGVGMDKYELKEESMVEIKKLVPVKRKQLLINIK